MKRLIAKNYFLLVINHGNGGKKLYTMLSDTVKYYVFIWKCKAIINVKQMMLKHVDWKTAFGNHGLF